MGVVPADIGAWSLARNLLYGGRLLTTHFGDMLPVILLFTFPASLIKVWHFQFHVELFIGHQGSTDPEPESVWTELFHIFLVDGVSQLLFFAGLVVTAQVLRDKVYREGHSQSFFTTLKLAFSRNKVPTDSFARLVKERRSACSPGKSLKASAAITLFIILYTVILLSGTLFTPEAVAEMGLPPWAIFVFTLLIAVTTALSASYFHLTGLLVILLDDGTSGIHLDLKSCV